MKVELKPVGKVGERVEVHQLLTTQGPVHCEWLRRECPQTVSHRPFVRHFASVSPLKGKGPHSACDRLPPGRLVSG